MPPPPRKRTPRTSPAGSGKTAGNKRAPLSQPPPSLDNPQADLITACQSELGSEAGGTRAARLHFEIARAQRDDKRALKHYQRAIEVSPSHRPSIHAARNLLLRTKPKAAIALYDKELKIATFDPGLAASLGLPVRWISITLIVVVAIAAVAAFEAVGSILVIAMFICPAATARMMTDTLSRQLWISAAVAAIAGAGGYAAAAFGPQIWGAEQSLSAAGMIAVVAGAFQLIAMIAAPRYGVLAQAIRRRRQRAQLFSGALNMD